MSNWEQLELEIVDLFDACAGADDYEQALVMWCAGRDARKRRADAERRQTTQWKRWMKEYEQREDRRRKKAERTRLWKQRNPEKNRAWAREYARKQRAAQKAA